MAAGARPVPWGSFGGTRKWLSGLTDLSSPLEWCGCGGAGPCHPPWPCPPGDSEFLGAYVKSPPSSPRKVFLIAGAEQGGLGNTRQPGRRPFLGQDTRAGTGTGAEAARKSVPFPPGSFCALLAASSHLPSCLPPSPSQLAPGGARTKVGPAEGAGGQGQEVRSSQTGLWGWELGAGQAGGLSSPHPQHPSPVGQPPVQKEAPALASTWKKA